MSEEHSTERLEHLSGAGQEKEHYTPRPKHHVILAWVLLGIVIFAFLGMCYWMAFGRF